MQLNLPNYVHFAIITTMNERSCVTFVQRGPFSVHLREIAFLASHENLEIHSYVCTSNGIVQWLHYYSILKLHMTLRKNKAHAHIYGHHTLHDTQRHIIYSNVYAEGESDNIIRSYEIISITVYALTFTGLNFCGFRGSIAIRESFIPRKFRPDRQRFCNYVKLRK